MRYISLIALLFLCSRVVALYYETDWQFALDVTLDPINPDLGDGKYSVNPDLPEGIVLDPTTGVVSGTPKAKVAGKQYVISYESADGEKDSISFWLSIFGKPVINCGISELTVSTPITTTIFCISDEFIITNGWTITPANIPGISIESGLLTFDGFFPKEDMEISVIGQGYELTGSTSFKVKKLANPAYQDGIWVTAHDLHTVKCKDYKDNVDSYKNAASKFSDLDGLMSQDGWRNKMYSVFSGIITSINATMVGFIDIQESGEYTFYMQTGNNMNARVIVNSIQVLSDWEQCNAWNDNPITNTTTLEKGYVPIYIEIRGGEGLDFKFVLQYSTPNDSTKKSIPFKYITPNFAPVTFLRVDAEKISWLNDAFSLTPLHVLLGKAKSCELTSGTLPEGSQVTADAITGHPQADMDYQTFKIKCKNDVSVTNEVTFQLRVTSLTVNGLVAYYYKPNNFDTSLRTKYGPSVDGIEPYYIQAVDDARIEEGFDGKQYPEGTNIEFLDDYGVYFEGYLKIGKNQAGKYNFKLQGEGGYWLYIDNKLIVEKPGRNRYDTETIVDFELTDDYYFYQIYYVAHNGKAHFEIASKLETSDKWDGFITDVFVPSYDYFVFKQRYATYLVGQKVENPIIEVGGDSVRCKTEDSIVVSPPLPEGLKAYCSKSMENSAIIAGTPTEYAELWDYTVSITNFDDKVYSYPIEFRVKEKPAPSGFYLEDLNTGKEYVDTMNLQIGKFYDLKVRLKWGYYTQIMTGNDIKTFDWDPLTVTYSGTATEELSNFEMPFTVLSEGNPPATFKFIFTANNTCGEGLVMHSFRMASNVTDEMQGVTIAVVDQDSKSIIKYSDVVLTSLPHTELKCLKPSNYTITVNAYDDYTFEVYSSGYQVFGVNTFTTKTKLTRTVVDTQFATPEFHYYTNKLEAYIGYDVLLVPITNGAYVEKYINNTELPQGLVLDAKTGRIHGVPEAEYYSRTITITALNDFNPAKFEIEMNVPRQDHYEERCLSQNKLVLTIVTHVEQNPNDMGYRLLSSNDSIIIERVKGSFDANKTYNLRICVSADWYNLQLVDYSTAGWRDGYVKIKVGTSVIGKYMVARGDPNYTKNVTMHLTYLLNGDSKWQYSQSYVDGWMFSNSTVAGGWPQSKISSLPMGPSIPTYYLRTQLTVKKELYSGYIVRYVHKAGVIVRINGIEVFRENLPSGNIDANTFATQSFPDIVERKFILPIKDLEEGGVISFEIHRASSDSFFPSEEKVYLIPLDGDNEEDCILLPIYDGKITESSSKSCKENPFCVDKAFDIDTGYASYWVDDYGNVQSQSFATLKFGEDNYYGFNQFYLAAGAENYDHYPSHVKVFGLQGATSTPLEELNPVYYFKDAQNAMISRATFNNDPYKLYTGIKIEIPKSNQPFTPYGMKVAEIGYQLCRYRTCEANQAELLPVGEANHIYDVNCTEGGEGIRKFYCSNKRNWIEIENGCNQKPTFINPPAIKTFKTGIELNDEALFLVSGSGITYTNSLGDAFIPGLKFDKLSGHVSGTPTKADSYPVTFTISNQFGSNQHSMVIIIEEGGNDIIIIAFNNSLTFNQYQKYDEFQIFWIESTLPVKYYSKNLPIGLSINVDTGMISGTPEVEGEKDVTVTLKNDKSSLDVNIKIKVVTNDDATIVRSESKIDLEYLKGYSNFKPLVCSGKGITYKVDKELPKDLVYDSNTGAFSGQVFADPQSAIDYVFTCTSSNGKSQKVSIPISVNRDADSPILVNKKEKVELTVGDDLVNEKWFEVTGEDLSYNYDVLPMGIELGEKSGLINGYPKEPFRSRDATFYVKNKNDKTISFEIGITVKPSEKPVIPDSSVYKNVSIPTGKPVSEKIFDVVGGDVFVSSIDPPLPSGFSINAQGYLQGLAVYDVAKTTYKITLSDAKGKSTIVEIPLEFVSMKCTAENDYAATPVGETAVKKCGGGKTGFIQRKCLSVDGKAVWQKEIDECSSSNTGALIGIIIGCIIGGGVIFLGGYCIYVRLGGTTKHVRKTAEHIVDTKDSGVRI